jgi:hypothetical protein
MVEISIDSGALRLDVLGWHRLLALKKRIVVPLDRIRGVRIDESVARGPKGLRLPGTDLPGVITAGSYYHKGEWSFWDLCDPAKAIVIDLAGDRYQRLIVEVRDREGAVRLIEGAIAGREGADREG